MKTGRNRTINRQKLIREDLERDLADRESLRYKVFTRLREFLQVRSQHPAFDPYGKQEILECGDSAFAVIRYSPIARERILCLQNITAVTQTVVFPQAINGIDIFNPTKQILAGTLQLSPYEGMWVQYLS